MRLKRLEINGFKSFPEKATISFPAGIFSIVGPNGCGKSNIIDALKWVMGEQSAMQLRGKSMDDVIFAGSNEKAPVNMAEVSLVLANDNGSAPEELRHLTEIMITRRLYRSGEREYLLNKQPCRLKDIYNIFLGSGMGARSYSIIQQGNIGAITDASPEERRMFIEEAAGVTRYKTRKEEALRKLRATDNDLLRIKDIMVEVQRNMNSLDRQAKKALRHKEYQARKKELDVLVSLIHHNALTGKITETDALLASLKDLDNEHASRIGSLDAAIETVKLERDAKSREISGQKERKFELQRKIDKTENELTHLRTERQRLEEEATGFEAEKASLNEKQAVVETEIAEADVSYRRITEENHAVREQLARQQEELQEIKTTREETGRQLESAKASLMRFTAEEARYHSSCQNVAENKESLKKRRAEIGSEKTTAARNATRLRNQVEQIQNEMAGSTDTIEQMEERIRVVSGKLDDRQNALTETIRRAHTLDMERNRIKSRHSAIKKMDDNFEWYKDGVQALMRNAAGRAAEYGILGIAADMVRPQPGYETATEAVLGEALQYICVETHDQGARLVESLRTDQAGRSGFIPLSVLNQEVDISGTAGNGQYDRLVDHLAVETGYEKMVHALIGNVLLAPDLETATTLWHSSNGSGRRPVVTLDGDLITDRGILVGGSKDRLSGILAKKQEIKDLESAMADLDRQIDQARKEQTTLEAVVREIEEDLQKIKNDRNHARAGHVELEKSLYRVSEELKHADHRLEILELEQQQLEGEESDMDDEIVAYSRSLQDARQAITDTEERIAGLNHELATVSETYESLSQSSMELRLKYTASHAELENTAKTLDRLKRFQTEGAARLEQITVDIRVKREKAAAIGDEIEKQEALLREHYVVLKGLEEALAENEAAYENIAAKIVESDRRFAEIRSQRDENAEKIRYLEMEQTDRRLQREHLERRIEERYGTAFEAAAGQYTPLLTDLDKSVEEMEAELTTLREKIARLGDVNMSAIEEFNQQKERLDFLTQQHDDLVTAIEDLHKVINKINRVSQERFLETFTSINQKMAEVFPRLFEGGTGELVLTDPSKPLETGVEMMVHPPGKKLTRLSLLSGGEKALSAIAFIFSIFLLKPTSFCLMDEIDAPLDEANIYRFNELLKIIGEKSQIIMITHNKKTMEFADSLLGVTMEKKGISKIVSVDLTRETTPQQAPESAHLN